MTDRPATDTEPPPAVEPVAAPPRRPSRTWLREEAGVLVVLVALVVVVGAFQPDFWIAGNLTEIARQSSYIGILAIGMVFALAMREVDLSVGGTYALTIVVGALLTRDGVSPWVAAVVAIAIGGLLGFLNGLFTTYVQVPSFIATLGTLSLYKGLALALSNGQQVGGLDQDHPFFQVVGGTILGLPGAVWALLLSAALMTVVFTRTRFGAQIRAVGSNPDAAAFTGIPVNRVRIKALTVTGLLAGVSGVLALSFFVAGDPTVGQGYELMAIAAAIIGGTPLRGGTGSVPGAVLGSLILSVVAASLVFFSVPINWTTFATGAVILLAVALDSGLRRARAARRRTTS
ncbi:ABC transporter permease [Cryptosporangium minutisporangium]|uniref:Autoinducer 2 import system permease protein LsrC n=1 Tax=Cryptosporangium minutisporangium TaxID=113569 RepID=A0ABP6TEA1_9ACTN